jgi:phosphoglycolate phosphatase-like HAD superfamily hydrolase
VALAIATHRSETGARQILQGFGLLDRFPVLVGLERIRRTKPDPEPVLLALRELGVEPASAAMVGDTPDDMRAGRAAGARTVGVTTGIHSRVTMENAGAEIVVDSLDELPSRLGI